MGLKSIIKKLPLVKSWHKKIRDLTNRDEFVREELSLLPKGSVLLDAGCGELQQFKKYCKHLVYKTNDLKNYEASVRNSIETIGHDPHKSKKTLKNFPDLDYPSNVWQIDEEDSKFDAILCTEVLEHIPYPIDAIKEFSRLLKKNGKLILTAPGISMRHADPFYFYSGFSNRFYEKILPENNFIIEKITPVGDYYSFLGFYSAHTAMKHGLIAKLFMLPSFIYFINKKKTTASTNTTCIRYNVVASKK